MLYLTRDGLENQREWAAAGVELPQYDVAAMTEKTKESPCWVHFGAGNIFRGFIAELQQRLLNAGKAETGIVALDTFDYEIIDQIYDPHDNLALLVLMNPDGTLTKRVVASVAEGLRGDSSSEDWKRLTEIFENPSLQMASFTITEKGYGLKDLAGNLLPVVQADVENGPSQPKHAMAVVAALAFRRFRKGSMPVAFVSMDNCSHNGEKLRDAVLTIAEGWFKNGFVSSVFLDYLKDPAKVSFPCSMIDKITPRPSDFVKDALTDLGIANMEPVITGKNTYIAPFVNAEAPQYLVVEDLFPNGRPPLEEAGVLFTDLKTVENTERMKVTTCLNPLHTALAVFGCLLGYTSIAEEMKDPDLKALTERIGYDEGMPVVVHPGILDPVKFIHEVVDLRLPNPFIPDAPQRIATDTSQKIAIRYGETIKAYLRNPELDTGTLIGIPLALAGWCRYLTGVGDDGEPMAVSPDPMLEQLQALLTKGQLRPILSNPVLFGVDLYQAGLGERVETLFQEMLAGKGAVRAVLQKYRRDFK